MVMVSKGQIVGIDWNRIARLHSHILKVIEVLVSFFSERASQ